MDELDQTVEKRMIDNPGELVGWITGVLADLEEVVYVLKDVRDRLKAAP